MQLRLASVALMSILITGCGGSTTETEIDSAEESRASGAPSTMTVTAAGEEHHSVGKVKESGVKGGDKMHAVLMGDSAGSPGGEPSVTMGLTTGSRRTGAFALAFNPNKLREGKDLATVTCEYAGGGGTFTGLKGSLNIDTLDTEPKGSAYRILRLVGSFEGTFRNPAGKDEPISGTFDYSAE